MKQKIKKSVTLSMIMVILMAILVVCDVQPVSAVSKVTGIKISSLPDKKLTLQMGKTKTLKVNVVTKGKKVSKAFTVKSNNSKIVKAVKSGSKIKLTAKKNGNTTVTITSKAKPKKKLVIQVTVETRVTQVGLNSTNVTLEEGQSTTLKATVNPSTASNKNVVWSTSDISVATVNSAGVVKAIKPGTATIKVTSSDGSNKSATCKINVKKAPNKIASVKVYMGNVIKVDLTKEQVLTKNNFTVMVKSADASSYVSKAQLDDVFSIDNKTYTVKLIWEEKFTLEDDIKVTITGLEGTNTASSYVLYGVDTREKYEYNYLSAAKYSETSYANAYVDNGMKGCYTYTYDKLPKGATIEKQNGRLYIYYKCNYYENMVSTFKFKDDQGNECTNKVYFGVYDDTHIYANVSDKTAVTSGTYYLDVYINEYGGSGKYSYELVSAPGSVYVSASGNICGTLLPGNHQIKYKVIDANDASISYTGAFNVTVRSGKTVSGKITDAYGRDIRDYRVEAIKNNSVSDKYVVNGLMPYYNSTGCYSIALEPGTYTIVVSVGNYSIYMYDVKVTGDMTGLNFKMPLYRVAIDMRDYISFGYWKDKDDKEIIYGNELYLKKGIYELTNTATTYDGEKKDVRISMNVTGDMTVKPIVDTK